MEYRKPIIGKSVRELELKEKNERLVGLCRDAIELLNEFCKATDASYGCIAHKDKSRQCELRDIEDRARELGIEINQ